MVLSNTWPSLRTKETAERYERMFAERAELGCALCDMPALRDFSHWKITRNDFPYDRIADKHTLLVSRRHVPESELTDEERAELIEIKNDRLTGEYQFILESTPENKSIPGHFHLHLVVMKEL